MLPKNPLLDIHIHSDQRSAVRSCSGSRLSIFTEISGYSIQVVICHVT